MVRAETPQCCGLSDRLTVTKKQRRALIKSTHKHGLRDMSEPRCGGGVVQDGEGDGMGCEL